QVSIQCFAATENLKGRTWSPAIKKQHAPCTRRRLHHRNRMLDQLLMKFMSIAGGLSAEEKNPPSGNERQVELQSCDIKRHRGHGCQHIALLHSRDARH